MKSSKIMKDLMATTHEITKLIVLATEYVKLKWYLYVNGRCLVTVANE